MLTPCKKIKQIRNCISPAASIVHPELSRNLIYYTMNTAVYPLFLSVILHTI